MAWMVAVVATLTMTVSFVDRAALSVLAVEVIKDLGMSKQQYGWAVSAFSVAYLFGTPIAGWWIDLAGARRGLIASVLAWSAVAALHALVPGFLVLFALRIALGLAEGPGFPGAAQTIQRVLPPSDRERGFGLLFTGSSIGTMLVPPFATWIFRHAGWRAALLVTTAAGLIWLPLWYFVTRSRDVRAKLDAGTRAATVDREPRPRFHELVVDPLLLRALAAIFTAAPIFNFPIAWGSIYLNATFHTAQADVGDYLWVPPLMFDAGALLFGHLAARQRRDEGVPARGLVAIAAALCATLSLLPLAATPWQATIGMGLGMAGCAALYTLVTADLLARMPVGVTSLAAGILSGAQSLALIIVNPLIGLVADRTGDYHVQVIFFGVWSIPGAVVWLAWRPALRYVPPARIHRSA
jgi:ACS family hexuronate transporter-like MFS transporter